MLNVFYKTGIILITISLFYRHQIKLTAKEMYHYLQ